MTKRVLLIDDLRNFRDPERLKQATVARTSQVALNILADGNRWDEIWFDHDLGLLDPALGERHENIDSTMVVVDYLSEQAFYGRPVQVDVVYVHTSNPAGRQDIMTALTRFGYNAVAVAPEPIFVVG